MKLLIAIYFFILAIIQMGLLIGLYDYYRAQNNIQPSRYWLGSLLSNVLALTIFGFGIVIVQDIAKPEFNFTIANALFYIAAVLQAFFCRSLNQIVSKRVIVLFGCSIIVFLFLFETLRQIANFEIRTAFMCILAGLFYTWQIFEIHKKNRHSYSSQLIYLQYASVAELFFAMGRLVIVITSTFTIRQVEQIPQILILFTITQMVMNTLSYIAIGSYWSEQIAKANAQTNHENAEIKALLTERELLIQSLLRANKTASTGALSASIAHELNQPLGASSLNIQYLQKKLADGKLDPALQKEVLDALFLDNQRAATIIGTLRSIFSDSAISSERLDLSEVIQSVLTISKPEITSKNIQVILRLENALFLNANRNELQQVILNLINNAIQAFGMSDKADKQLSILGAKKLGMIELSIADNGIGVAPEAQQNLFELLSSTKQSGMGLGLWLCKHIITRHGGSIHYETLASGGAMFVIRLPIN